MKSYEPSTPRTAFGIAAVALTALTISLGVVLPAAINDNNRGSIELAVTPGAETMRAATPTEDVALRYIDPVEVVAYRTREISAVQNRTAQPRRKEQG